LRVEGLGPDVFWPKHVELAALDVVLVVLGHGEVRLVQRVENADACQGFRVEG